MARRHRPLFPLPCPRRNRYAPSSSPSPLGSVSAMRRKLRPLPCSSSPNRTRWCWASIWGGGYAAGYGRIFAKSAQLRFRLAAKTALAPLLLLSKPNPLRWASVWDGGFAAECGRIFAKSARLRFRLAAKTAPAPLLLLSKPNPLALGFDLAGGFAAVWEKTVLVWEN